MPIGKSFFILITLATAVNGILTRADYFYRKDRPFVIAHRGMWGHYPEHTLPAYVEAYYAGVDWIEMDIQLTKDGVPLVAHDIVLEHNTNIGDKGASDPYKDR